MGAKKIRTLAFAGRGRSTDVPAALLLLVEQQHACIWRVPSSVLAAMPMPAG